MKAWSQTYPLIEGAGLHVQQLAGPVQIVGVSGGEVKLTASCKDDVDVAEYIDVRQTPKGLLIEMKSRRWGWGGVPGIRLDLEVPQGTPCQVESGSGPVEISGTGASVRVETGSGSVKVVNVGHADLETGSGAIFGRNINGSVSAETGSGGIEFSHVNGSLSVDTGSGPVSAKVINGDVRVDNGSGELLVEDVSGRVDLDTGSGGVCARRVRGSSLSVDSGGGGIRLKEIDVAQLNLDTSGGVEVELQQLYAGGKYEISTGSGGVVVAIPPTAGVRVRAEAESGRIVRSGLNFRVIREDAGELEAILNEGLAELRVEAGSGGIRLIPLEKQAPPTGLSAAGARVVESVKGDPALESSEQLKRIVTMVEEGKLTPQEALELLRALDEEEPA